MTILRVEFIPHLSRPPEEVHYVYSGYHRFIMSNPLIFIWSPSLLIGIVCLQFFFKPFILSFFRADSEPMKYCNNSFIEHPTFTFSNKKIPSEHETASFSSSKCNHQFLIGTNQKKISSSLLISPFALLVIYRRKLITADKSPTFSNLIFSYTSNAKRVKFVDFISYVWPIWQNFSIRIYEQVPTRRNNKTTPAVTSLALIYFAYHFLLSRQRIRIFGYKLVLYLFVIKTTVL